MVTDSNTHQFFMQIAIDVAWGNQLLTYPNPAVGAVVVEDGKILSIEAHKKAGSSHAEVLALVSAYETKSGKKVSFDKNDSSASHEFLRSLPKDFFSKCSIYVTLEPCSHIGKTPSCAMLLGDLNLADVYVACKDPIVEHSGGAEYLSNLGIDVKLGILEAKAKELLEPFTIWQNRAFVVFKLAQSLNGRIGGKNISSLPSRTHMHDIRNVCSKLLIGGSTVRSDRPILDSRLVDGKAPDVFIYSKDEKMIDKSIPLFNVENRSVEIGDNLDFLSTPSLVMIEGGGEMLEALRDKIDWLLVYQAPTLSANKLSYNTDLRLKTLHIDKKEEDIIIWSKKI
ncbi:MAG: bifunctional diaminohydroxyphosphoribosylaminopyrimidine deaminase/5-amino-6-(5-phosphoribosylamino)uracil reductase RibD [Sulfurovaceae bacterium]|nr:bifunctional diaminohydroxyphosphoribosylaminopyrimidine deaminase/5-amino-6-(5-phosphoribosylamino)uracil reductase RibD [Sulfurovaceae bacterium]